VVPMRRRTFAPSVALAVAVVVTGCGGGGAGDPVPAGPVPTRTVPPPTLSPTTLLGARPRAVRVVDGFTMFEVNAQQYELIGRRLTQVLHREGLWDQGVRFGANADPARDWYIVLIKPGLSQLSPRQILNRLLGVY
jgi:hypothetical protein